MVDRLVEITEPHDRYRRYMTSSGKVIVGRQVRFPVKRSIFAVAEALFWSIAWLACLSGIFVIVTGVVLAFWFGR